MKHNTTIHRTALLSVLSLGLGASALQAQKSYDTEKSDPFNKGAAQTESKTPNDQGAEMLDAQARILFARGETEKAIVLQTQAVEKAKNTADKFAETLSKYHGYPANFEVLSKLDKIIMPRIDFNDTSLEEAVDFLRQRSQELDLIETDPAKKGFNFVIRHSFMLHGDAVKGQQVIVDTADAATPSQNPNAVAGQQATAEAIPAPLIKELRLKNAPIGVVLKYICGAIQYKYSVEDGVIILAPGR